MPLANILRPHTTLADLAALLMRLVFDGTMALSHGYGKLTGMNAEKFHDPLGIGNAASYWGAVSGEFFCCILIVLGLFSRIACLPAAFTMGVAFFVVHKADKFQTKELAFLYLCAFTIMLILGPGRFSLDHVLFCKKHEALRTYHGSGGPNAT